MVVETLRRRRYTAYFAGGCVRDRLLDVAVKDSDMATDARPDDRRDALDWITGRWHPADECGGVGRISQKRNPTSFNPFPYRKGRQGAYAQRPGLMQSVCSERAQAYRPAGRRGRSCRA